MVRDSLRGTSLWRNLMLLTSYVFLFVILFFVLFDFYFGVIPALVVFAIWLFVAYTVLREEKIRIYRKYGGKKVITGTLGQEEDMGEITEFIVKRIVPFEDLTDNEKKSVGELIAKEEHYLSQLDAKDNVRYSLMDKSKDNNGNKEKEEDDGE